METTILVLNSAPYNKSPTNINQVSFLTNTGRPFKLYSRINKYFFKRNRFISAKYFCDLAFCFQADWISLPEWNLVHIGHIFRHRYLKI